MSTSLIGGLIQKGKVRGEDLYLYEPNTDKATQLRSKFNVQLSADNAALVQHCDVIVLAVKPQVLESVLEPIKAQLQSKLPLIVSIVAGIRSESISAWCGTEMPIVRVMPNTPALIGMSASGLFANSLVSSDQQDFTEDLMNSVGRSAWVPSESDIDAVTALSGSGPAYFMLFMQSLIGAAEQAGISPETAKMLATQTAAGAAKMVANSDLPLQTLIENVTSPNGTTQRALESFANDDLNTAVLNAFIAAKQRSEELADELG